MKSKEPRSTFKSSWSEYNFTALLPQYKGSCWPRHWDNPSSGCSLLYIELSRQTDYIRNSPPTSYWLKFGWSLIWPWYWQAPWETSPGGWRKVSSLRPPLPPTPSAPPTRAMWLSLLGMRWTRGKFTHYVPSVLSLEPVVAGVSLLQILI